MKKAYQMSYLPLQSRPTRDLCYMYTYNCCLP